MRTGDVAVARVDREAAFGRLAETHLDAAYRLATFISSPRIAGRGSPA